MKTTVSELVELVEKIDTTRANLLKNDDGLSEVAADLLWDYRDMVMRTKVDI